MALKTERREIDGIALVSTQLPAMRSFRLLARLGRALAPAVGALRGVTLGMDATVLAPAIAAIFEHLGPDEAVTLALAALQSTVAIVDGKQVELTSETLLDIAFNGKPLALLGAVRFALEVNFADFFSAAAAASAAQSSEKVAAVAST